MSARNSRKEKQLRRLRKAYEPGLTASIDLIEYLTSRKLAKSKKEARQLCLDGKVKVDSHTVGRIQVDDVTAPGGTRFVLFPNVPAEARGLIWVTK